MIYFRFFDMYTKFMLKGTKWPEVHNNTVFTSETFWLAFINNRIALSNWLWGAFKFGSKVWVWSLGSLEVAWYATLHWPWPPWPLRSLQSLAFKKERRSVARILFHSVHPFKGQRRLPTRHLPTRHLSTRHLSVDIFSISLNYIKQLRLKDSGWLLPMGLDWLAPCQNLGVLMVAQTIAYSLIQRL